MTADSDLDRWLREFVAQHGAVAGTVHARVRGEVDQLELRAALNIPPKVIELTGQIPIGKGMAGLAWERDRPVSTCNLKTDASGDVRPGARAVDASAAVALPIHVEDGAVPPDGDRVRGVVGIAFAGEREMDDVELAALAREAERAPL